MQNMGTYLRWQFSGTVPSEVNRSVLGCTGEVYPPSVSGNTQRGFPHCSTELVPHKPRPGRAAFRGEAEASLLGVRISAQQRSTITERAPCTMLRTSVCYEVPWHWDRQFPVLQQDSRLARLWESDAEVC